MKLPISWLRSYVDVTLTPAQLAERLTMSGSKVEGVELIGEQWREITVGRVVRLAPHPNADALQLVTLALGPGVEQTVVTGAMNLHIGDKVPFAPVGVTLPTGVTLKPRALRGIASEGMVLADDELGLGDDHSGIRILDPSTRDGMSLADLLGDAILDLEITSNRPDCLSITGLAREVAAVTNEALREPDTAVSDDGPPVSTLLEVRLDAPDLCPRFVTRVIQNVVVAPSPPWLAARLRAAGMRPVNNIVDITNFVMLELGQPMHPYDLGCIAGQTLVVRRAKSAERLLTLDGQERLLTPDMVIIADGDDTPLGLAGIMGGGASEISDATTTVALEVANWAPANIRRTSTALGLRSEASSRYEKGLPPYLARLAADRAARLMVELAGGCVAAGLIDVGERAGAGPDPLTSIDLPLSETRRLLGIDVDTDTVRGSLEPLGFAVAPSSESDVTVRVTVPAWRADVEEEADVVEEIARIVGYDRIPETLLRGGVSAGPLEPGVYWHHRLRRILLACGLDEAATYTLTSAPALARLRPTEAPERPLTDDDLAAMVVNRAGVSAAGASCAMTRLENPMTPEHDTLRPTLAVGLLDTLAVNARAGAESVRLFEVGRCYFPRSFADPRPSTTPMLERRTLGVVLSGRREEPSWNTSDTPLDFYDLKGIAEEFLSFCGVDRYTVQPASHPLLHPGRAARLSLTNRKGEPSGELAYLGDVHPAIAARFELRRPTLLMELDIDALAAVATDARTYHDISRYPETKRDLSVVVGETVPADAVLRAVRQAGGKLLRRAHLVDVYTGPAILPGQRSLTLALDFQSMDETLSDASVDRLIDAIRRRLTDTVRASFRD